MNPSYARGALSTALVAALVTVAACKREERRFIEVPPTATPSSPLTISGLQPGPSFITATVESPYDDIAYSVAQGKKLFSTMNCSGCHAHGGGSIGPALMDDQWIYGSGPEQIFASIAQGRPNGMPTWKYKLSTQQIWELVSYVRSLSGLIPKSARPGRGDHMMVKNSEQQTSPRTPVNSSVPLP